MTTIEKIANNVQNSLCYVSFNSFIFCHSPQINKKHWLANCLEYLGITLGSSSYIGQFMTAVHNLQISTVLLTMILIISGLLVVWFITRQYQRHISEDNHTNQSSQSKKQYSENNRKIADVEFTKVMTELKRKLGEHKQKLKLIADQVKPELSQPPTTEIKSLIVSENATIGGSYIQLPLDPTRSARISISTTVQQCNTTTTPSSLYATQNKVFENVKMLIHEANSFSQKYWRLSDTRQIQEKFEKCTQTPEKNPMQEYEQLEHTTTMIKNKQSLKAADGGGDARYRQETMPHRGNNKSKKIRPMKSKSCFPIQTT